MSPPLTSGAAPAKKYYSIQALRFLSAFMVIVWHSTLFASERLDSALQLYYSGANGVRLFFVISGFVMIISSETLKDDVRGWATFALRRVIRIVPLYWIATTAKLIVLFTMPSVVLHAQIDWLHILKSYLFIPSVNSEGHISPLIGAGWTLFFEMFFYLIFSVSLLLKLSTIPFVGCFLIVLAISSIFKTSNWPPLTIYADPIVLDFLFGMIAANLIINGLKLPRFLAVLAIIVGVTYLFLPAEQIGLHFRTCSLVTSTSAFLVVFGCASVDNWIGNKIPAPALFLGASSYSLYLSHGLIAPAAPVVLRKLGLVWPQASVVLSIAIAVLGGAVVYVTIERPAARVLTKLAFYRT